MALTIQQAKLVLDSALNRLSLAQRQDGLHLVRLSIRSSALTPLSCDLLSDAVEALSAAEAPPLIEEFLDAVFTTIYAQLERSSQGHSTSLEVLLEVISDIIHAVNLACTRERHKWVGQEELLPRIDTSAIFKSRIANSLLRIGDVLEQCRQQRIHSGAACQSTIPQTILQCEEVLATILMAMLHSDPCKELDRQSIIVDIVTMAVRLYDENVLPLHLSPDCHVDSSFLLSGILALLQHLARLRSVESMRQAEQEIGSRLCASDIVRRCIRCMQSSASDFNVAKCEALIVALTVGPLGVFHEDVSNAHALHHGDLIPALDSLRSLKVDNLEWHLRCQTDDLLSDLRDQQRWAIALYFLELSTSKRPCTKNQIKQVLSDIISKGQTEHLCGSSWIQLIWMYTRMDNEADGPSPRMSPFSYSRIMKGLRLSIQRPQGWFSRSLLTRCLDDVLPWLWRQNWDYDESSVHISNELLQELMLMWLLHWSPDAWKDSSKLIEPDKVDGLSGTIWRFPCALSSLKIVFEDICGVLKSSVGQLDDGHRRPDILLVLCSVIRSMSARLGQRECGDGEAAHLFFEAICTISITTLSSRSLPSLQGSSLLWQMLKAVLPLFKPSNRQEAILSWQHVPFNCEIVISELLRQIENLQTPDRCLEALSSSMQLAMIVVESGQGDIFKDEPQLLSSLWIIIHHLMDEILLVQQSPRSPQRTEIECIVHGLLLLSEASALQLTVFMMSENDMILATYYVLEIRDYQLRGGYGGERVAIIRLILGLAKQSMDRLAYDSTTFTENRRSDGNANDGYTELLMNLDLLLDTLRDDIITTIDSEAVWTSLSEVKASFLGPTEHATTTPAPTTFSLLHLCAPHFLLESATLDMIKHLLLRWHSDATRLLQRYSSSSSMSSCSALMSCTATLTGRSQQEAGIAMTIRGSESADDVCCMTGRWPVRIAQAAADILEILKLAVVVSRSHNQGSSGSTGQIASQTGDAQPDQKASHIVNSKLFSDVATTIQEIRHQSALPENASAPIHSAPALIAALELLSWIQDNARLR